LTHIDDTDAPPMVTPVSGLRPPTSTRTTPERNVGEADNRVRDSRGGSPCGENRCGIGECREGEGTRGAPQERAKLTQTIFCILRSYVSGDSISKAGETRPLHVAPFGLISGAVIIWKTIYDFLMGDPNIILLCIGLLGTTRKKTFFCVKKILKIFLQKWPLEFPLTPRLSLSNPTPDPAVGWSLESLLRVGKFMRPFLKIGSSGFFLHKRSLLCRCGKQLEYGLLSAWPQFFRPKLGRRSTFMVFV
jgi:hypothetical protein